MLAVCITTQQKNTVIIKDTWTMTWKMTPTQQQKLLKGSSPAHNGAKAFATRHKMDKIPSAFKQGADQDKLDPMIRSLCIKATS